MSFGQNSEQGRPLTIKDEGVTLNASVNSIDFVGAGVSGSAIGDEITETIPGGYGDLFGPASSVDNTIARFDGTTGKLVQGSSAYLLDSGYLGLGASPSVRFHVLGTTTSDIGRFDIGVDFNQVAQPTTAPTLALIASAGNVNDGVHFYRITYKTAVGETQLNTGAGATTTAITTSAGNQQVAISGLPVSSDYRVTHVCIYRAVTGNIYYNDVKKVGEVANGVTTFTDNIADSSRTGVNSFARLNTTNRFLTVNSSPSMMIASTDTYLGYRAGEGAILGTSSGGENQFFGALIGTNPLGSKNVVMGYNIPVGSSDSSVLIGHGAASVGSNFYNAIVVGRNAAVWNTYCLNSVILGGAKGTTYYQASYISSVGMEALSAITTGASALSILGAFAARNLTTSSGSIAVGAYVDLPSATVNGQLNIGNVIYGLGMYNVLASSSTPTSNGSIGIGKNTTAAARLELAAGTSSIAPFKLFAGTNKTTAAAGEMEFDGTSFYLTPSTIRNTIALLQTTQTWTATQTFTMPSSATVALIAKAAASPSTDLMQFQKSDGTVFAWFSAEIPGVVGPGVLTVKDKGIAIVAGAIGSFHTDDQNPYQLCLYNDTVSQFVPSFSVFTYNSGHVTISNENNAPMSFCTNSLGNVRLYIAAAGQIGAGGITSPTAVLHLAAGTTAASTAPLKFTSGSFQTTTEAGTMEFLAERFTIAPTSLARMSIVGTLFTQTADKTIANTVTETTLFGTGVTVGGGLTLPANFFVAGKTLKLHIHGYHSSTGNPNVTIKIKLGSTVVATATGVSGNGATDGFFFDGEITCRTTGATGTVSAGGQYDEVHTSGLNLGIVQTGTTTIDTTASQVLDVTVTWGTADAGNTITSQIAYVTVLN